MDLQNKQNEVVVVEGYHDLAKLKEIYSNIDVIITNGSEISPETLEELKKLNESRGLILFLDPDYQGERIRRIINDYVGETKHAFMKKSDCINKNKTKVGIEHADFEKIKQALDKIYVQNNKITFDVFGFTKKNPGIVAIVKIINIKNNQIIEFTMLKIAEAINATNINSIKKPFETFINFSCVITYILK